MNDVYYTHWVYVVNPNRKQIYIFFNLFIFTKSSKIFVENNSNISAHNKAIGELFLS